MKTISKIFLISIISSSAILFCIILLPIEAKARLSDKEEQKLNELTGSLKPNIPIFGKLEEPLKAGIALFQYTPNTINIQSVEEEKPKEVIKLIPTKEEEKDLSKLKSERSELQKQEEEGLNFIQPSLALTEEEQKAIDEFFSRNEQEQLLNLWKATIERNRTIQFIVQKLTPLDSPQKANSLLSKTIGAAVFLPFYALQAFSNNAGAYVGSQVGSRILGSVVEGKMRKNQAEMQLSQTEAIILFMMVDEVAERLRERYHSYKKFMIERALASKELEETKKDSLDARDSKSPGAEVIASIQRRSVEREVRRLDAQIRSQKNALVELAGPLAVNDLDKQLQLELAATQNTPLDFIGAGK